MKEEEIVVRCREESTKKGGGRKESGTSTPREREAKVLYFLWAVTGKERDSISEQTLKGKRVSRLKTGEEIDATRGRRKRGVVERSEI